MWGAASQPGSNGSSEPQQCQYWEISPPPTVSIVPPVYTLSNFLFVSPATTTLLGHSFQIATGFTNHELLMIASDFPEGCKAQNEGEEGLIALTSEMCSMKSTSTRVILEWVILLLAWAACPELNLDFFLSTPAYLRADPCRHAALGYHPKEHHKQMQNPEALSDKTTATQSPKSSTPQTTTSTLKNNIPQTRRHSQCLHRNSHRGSRIARHSPSRCSALALWDWHPQPEHGGIAAMEGTKSQSTCCPNVWPFSQHHKHDATTKSRRSGSPAEAQSTLTPLHSGCARTAHLGFILRKGYNPKHEARSANSAQLFPW